MSLASDWDGTMVDHLARPNYDDANHLAINTRPHVGACERLQRLIQQGHTVHIVTGRGPHVREVTLNQVRLFVDWRFPAERLHMQPKFTSYAALRDWKADCLRRIGATLYVGDHYSDLGAASDAGVPFMEADAFRAGHAIPARCLKVVA